MADGERFVKKRDMRNTVVDKIKMSDDHSLIAFTVDIGNNERLTGGIKSMKTGKLLRDVKLEGISQIEFAKGNNLIIYVEMDEHNRPYKVKSRDLSSGDEKELFVDNDATHYVDIALSKDKEYIFIYSATKEEGEVWIIKNDGSLNP
jgi:protease II